MRKPEQSKPPSLFRRQKRILHFLFRDEKGASLSSIKWARDGLIRLAGQADEVSVICVSSAILTPV
jgi:hypothetical protein